MRLTKFTHSCVRLERDNDVLVIDPGIWSEPGALSGAGAVLVTHEHADHIDVLRLAGLGARVFLPAGAEIGPADVVSRLDIVRVSPGESFTAAGFEVTAVGGWHATIYGGKPSCANLGYVVDGQANGHVYHPGDSLYVPQEKVTTLLAPLHASWLKTDEAIDFIKAVSPKITIPIHEGQVNERAIASTGGWLAEETDNGYRYLAPRDAIDFA